jgi:zona occludens toxin (predicted ATPase)
MAIYIIDGKIGSGKTYYAMWHILRKNYTYDPELKEYVEKSGRLLITNIDGFKLDHISLDAEIDRLGLSGVFSESYFLELREKYRCRSLVFIMDEAQKHFHYKFADKDIVHALAYSRHSGVDFYLITQDAETMSKPVRTLAESTVHAVNRTSLAQGVFMYKFINNDEVVGRKVLKADKKIFAAYKSFNFDEAEKPKPVWLKYCVLVLVCIIASVLLFKFVFLDFWTGKKYSEKKVPVPVYGVLSASPGKSDLPDKIVSHPVSLSKTKPVSDKLDFSDCRKTSDYRFDRRHIENFICDDQSIRVENGKIIYQRSVYRFNDRIDRSVSSSSPVRTPPAPVGAAGAKQAGA